MKYIHPHLNLNISRAEKRLEAYLVDQFPAYEPPRPTASALEAMAPLKDEIDLNYEAIEVIQAPYILESAEKLRFIFEHGKQLIQTYYRQLQLDKRQMERDVKFAESSAECLNFQRNWLPFIPYRSVFRPGFDHQKLVKRQNRFAAELESKSHARCTAQLPPQMLYFVDLTRLVRLCWRLPVKGIAVDDFAAINDENQEVDLNKFFE